MERMLNLHRRTPSPATRVAVSPPKGGLQDKDVRKHLTCGLSADDETLLRAVRKRCKSFRVSHEWLAPACNGVYNLGCTCALSGTPMLSNLTVGEVSNIVAIDVKGLVNVVPHNGPGDKAKEYCINGFAIGNYSALLVEQQRLFPKWCRHSLFAKTTKLTQVQLASIRYMLRSAVPKHMLEGVSQIVAVALAVTKIDIYTDALTTSAVVHRGGHIRFMWSSSHAEPNVNNTMDHCIQGYRMWSTATTKVDT
ncbi:hypothetical protein Cgig2_025335 [Carnegiea gigantea]|uniref:Uncharacterized protein n=1 Tax=Carnegiea gigantea TaxID=171969 RepID=A0A9Q1JRV9_9CARY|nr:hypothetical protein Cgig2_025335 [Carnegiea gigantea]